MILGGPDDTQGLAGFPPRASVWMWISSTHANVLSVSCLMQFGEGKKKYKHTQKLQPEVCRGLEAAQGQAEPSSGFCLGPRQTSCLSCVCVCVGALHAMPALWGD